MEKSPDRLKILEKIEEYEKKGWFSKDVEDDPQTIPLTLDMVDYVKEKPLSIIKMKIANFFARVHINKLIKNKQLIIKDVRGLENFKEIPNEAIITCNHFNAFDNFAVYKSVEPYIRKKELYKVCREGNYTSFPGLYGWFFRNCNTLPLSSNFHVMKKFMESCKILLNRGEKILIYPEQGMWWNYRKPRPMENGAFRLAAANKVPVIPFFITMEDSQIIGGDGFPIQEYTIHISKAIFPKEDLSMKENMEYLKNKNFEIWKDIYEKFYNIPLEYTTENKVE